MPIEPTSSESVMEGKGAYNKYAKLPAGGSSVSAAVVGKRSSKPRRLLRPMRFTLTFALSSHCLPKVCGHCHHTW
jgi:hypothetical protein